MSIRLEEVWTQIQRAETLLVQTGVKQDRPRIGAYFKEFDLDVETRGSLVRMSTGLDPRRMTAADYLARYPFSSLEAIGEALERLVQRELVVARGAGFYSVTELGERIVRGWIHVIETLIQNLDLGDIPSADVERLLEYDRRIQDGIQAASRPHGKPIFNHRMQSLHPSYEPPALWQHWLYILNMLTATEDEREYVRQLRGIEPLVWFVRRQIWFVHRRPWLVRGAPTLENLVRRATGYSPMQQAEAACQQALEELQGRGWVEALDEDYRLTEEGLALCDEDERQAEAAFVSMWPDLHAEERGELLDIATRLNERLEWLASRIG